MTNTETVSTERLQKMLDAEIPLGMSVKDARSIITELLAARTQSPAEWEGKFTQPVPGHWDTDEGTEMANAYADMPRKELAMWNVPDLALANAIFMANRGSLELIGLQVAAKERIRWLSVQLAKALRAASIPAPERSKGETAGSFQMLMDAYIRGNRWAHENGLNADGLNKAAYDYADKTLSALETPVVAWGNARSLARPFEGGAWERVVSAVKQEHYDVPLYAVPVPVTITDEMVERLARHYAGSNGVQPNEPLYDGSERLAWHAWIDDAREALTIAFSVKPGEQG